MYGIKHSLVSSQPGTADPTALITSTAGSGTGVGSGTGSTSSIGSDSSMTVSGGGGVIESSKTQFSYSIGNEGLEE